MEIELVGLRATSRGQKSTRSNGNSSTRALSDNGPHGASPRHRAEILEIFFCGANRVPTESSVGFDFATAAHGEGGFFGDVDVADFALRSDARVPARSRDGPRSPIAPGHAAPIGSLHRWSALEGHRGADT